MAMTRKKADKFKKAAIFAALLVFCFCSNLIIETAYKARHGSTAPCVTTETNLLNDQQIILPIIMYHAAYPKSSGMYNLLPTQIESDLIYIKENGFTPVFVSEVIAFQESGKSLPSKPIMITFDDAALSVYFYAWPIFKKHEIKFIISPIGSYTDANYMPDGSLNNQKRSHMNWEQLKELYDSGLAEIQSHTYNLHRSTRQRQGLKKNKYESNELYIKNVGSDLVKMKDLIKEKTGADCTAVAYPFGAYSPDIGASLKQLGFKAGFTCYEKLNYLDANTDLFLLHRFNRPGNLSTKEFFEKKLKAARPRM